MTALQCTGSPTITGTMWLGLSITGRRASAISPFTVRTRSFSRARSISLRFRCRIEASAPAAIAGASEVVKMKPGA